MQVDRNLNEREAAIDASQLEAANVQPNTRLELPQRQRFMVTKLLGSGAQANVYSAHVDTEASEGAPQESVAIKVFNSSALTK